MSEPEELHDLEPGAFYERVHSFEFWFQAVQGYLQGTHFGHAPDTEETLASGEDRERLVTVLCNYCVGETAALEGAGGLIEIAPNRDVPSTLMNARVGSDVDNSPARVICMRFGVGRSA